MVSHDFALISSYSRSSSGRCISSSYQFVQTEALEGSKEGIILSWGWFPGCGALVVKKQGKEDKPAQN